MIDNFKHIRKLLTFSAVNDYYLITIVKLRRDNESMNQNSKFIRSYYVYSLNDFDLFRDEILCACEVVRARAYIWLNVRNAETTSFECLLRLSELLKTKKYQAVQDLFRKVSSDTPAPGNQMYLADISSPSDLLFAKDAIREAWEAKAIKESEIHEIVTPNGYHLVCAAFDIGMFNTACPNIRIHHDGPTVLYAPLFTQAQVDHLKDTKNC